MNATELTYPAFEANQVLTNAHLNDLFEYLDEQERLTRANLIGIGIACGLEMRFDAPGTVHLSKGIGVTTQGYLVMEPEDVALVAVRPYTLPVDPGYAPFLDAADPPRQLDLWELLPDDEPGTEPLATSGLVPDDKAVVLFLELRRDGLRTCSPNDCDDRGAEVTATLRRLLIDADDLDGIIDRAGRAAEGLVATDLGTEITDRLALPDLRMPRFDVPRTSVVQPEQVLAGFQSPFRREGLAAATRDALQAAYRAFEPLVAREYGSDPFANFGNRFGFLDVQPASTTEARATQHYWDVFDDLLAAYDELRWEGVDLLCACCPPEGLFPRHLMVGVLDPSNHADPSAYRHRFVPSPAVGDCEDRTQEVLTLFRRLVTMVRSFTDAPPLPDRAQAGTDTQIRITPSRWGDAPLGDKAIPYYYEFDDAAPLYEAWDPVKRARRRSNQNLGYRADEFQPIPPRFVTDPLRFDLEPNDFLRIEGHLGKPVGPVLQTLLSLRRTHRLPIDVVALRTGAFDEDVEIDLSEERCRFEDLETLYDALQAELRCFLVKQVQYFYGLPVAPGVGLDSAVVSTLPLLRRWAPDHVVQPGTMGSLIEAFTTWRPGRPFIAIVWGPPDPTNSIMSLTSAMSELGAQVTDDLAALDVAALADRYRRLVEVANQFAAIRPQLDLDAPGLDDRLDDIVFRCRLDPFEALVEEHRRRVRDVKQAQFLSHFLEEHPGIQHKAGVPLGGTFVLVYHEASAPVRDSGRPRDTGSRLAALELGRLTAGPRFEFDEAEANEIGRALSRFQFKNALAEDPDVQLVYQLFTGNLLVPRVVSTDDVYRRAIQELDDGTVIADFFLPYQRCSDCSPIRYTLPPAQLHVDGRAACTGDDGFAEVTLTVVGATGAVSVQVDDGPFRESTGALRLVVGDHTVVVRDDTGAQSAPATVTVPPQLRIGGAETAIDEQAGTFTVRFAVEGGTPPYVADPGNVVDATYTSPALPVAQVLDVTVRDAAGCTVQGTFESGVTPCELPCGGQAIRRGHRFWLPEARENMPVNGYGAEVSRFVITDQDGDEIDLAAEVARIVGRAPDPIRTADFQRVVERWLQAINRLVTDAVGSDQWINLQYEPAGDGATTGTLWIDRIQCIELSFEIRVNFVQGRRERPLELTYSSRGTGVVDPSSDAKVHIPAFGGSTSDKCRPEEPPQPICDAVDVGLEIGRDGRFPEPVVLTAVVSGSDQPVAFLWEVQDGIPSLAGGEQVVLGFEPPEPIEKLVRLTAFTERGCTALLEQVVLITDF
jgi:hypothetical protein